MVVNPLNSAGRQQSDAMHELSHILLRHETRQLERIGDLVFLQTMTLTASRSKRPPWSHALTSATTAGRAFDAQGLTISGIAETFGVSEWPGG